MTQSTDDKKHVLPAADGSGITTIVDSLDALVYVSDMETYELLFVNQYGRSIWGDIQGKTCWKVLQAGQDGPCPFCTNNRLLDVSGAPTGAYVWEFRNTVNKRWYQCRDQAIRWSDGRLVRLEIATDITDRKLMEEELLAAKHHAEELALKDELTGLSNRRAFFDRGHRAFLQSIRYGHPFSLLMTDLDHFKMINDNYGHAIGDWFLQEVAKVLQSVVREIDIVARMGGEEFAIALPETDLDAAANLAERLRLAIENLTLDHHGQLISITASFGVVTRRKGDETIEALLTNADDALYVAKKKGRNQIKKCY